MKISKRALDMLRNKEEMLEGIGDAKLRKLCMKVLIELSKEPSFFKSTSFLSSVYLKRTSKKSLADILNDRGKIVREIDAAISACGGAERSIIKYALEEKYIPITKDVRGLYTDYIFKRYKKSLFKNKLLSSVKNFEKFFCVYKSGFFKTVNLFKMGNLARFNLTEIFTKGRK